VIEVLEAAPAAVEEAPAAPASVVEAQPEAPAPAIEEAAPPVEVSELRNNSFPALETNAGRLNEGAGPKLAV
jgi:hypothetical protein